MSPKFFSRRNVLILYSPLVRGLELLTSHLRLDILWGSLRRLALSSDAKMYTNISLLLSRFKRFERDQSFSQTYMSSIWQRLVGLVKFFYYFEVQKILVNKRPRERQYRTRCSVFVLGVIYSTVGFQPLVTL